MFICYLYCICYIKKYWRQTDTQFCIVDINIRQTVLHYAGLAKGNRRGDNMRESLNRSQMELNNYNGCNIFLCISLGSSTVQLHGSLGIRRACACSEGSFNSQNGDCAWGILLKSRILLCVSSDEKDLMRIIFTKKYFQLTVGNIFHVKWSTNGWKIFRRWSGWNRDAEVTETTVKWLLCCGFRRTGKEVGQMYSCWWGICQEINVFIPGSNITCLSFISICDLCTDSPSYM
jgi:hypothetical protein